MREKEKLPYHYERIADQKRLKFILNILKMNLPEHGKVLDVGCGNGIISMNLGREGFKVKGIDISEKAIEKAKNNNPFENVEFENLSAEALTARGERYEAIICSEVLEHMENPGQLLDKLHDSLTDNGTLIVTVPNGRGPRELLVTRPMIRIRDSQTMWKIVNKLKKGLGYSGTTVQSDADNLDHIQFFTKPQLKRLSEGHGFKITSFKNANFMDDVFPFSFIANRIKVFQRLDCAIADILPHQMTGGFMMSWNKK
jgi:2-polyprenyl-3-methyl-5-hydroxy-6-metoxy-1,4-benzoquinol methylase